MKQNSSLYPAVLFNIAFVLIAFVNVPCYSQEIQPPRLLLAVSSMPSTAEALPPLKPDSDVVKFLDKESLNIFLNPDRIWSYRTDGTRTDGKEDSIQGYPITARGKALTAEQTRMIQAMIVSAESYEFQWSKRTKVRPSYAFRFFRGAAFADILIDPDSRQWAFYHDKNIAIEDISKDIAMPKLSGMMDTLFEEN